MNESPQVDPAFEGLNPAAVWQNFDRIRKIPRRSRNETAVMKSMAEWAREHNFECTQDDAGNMCIKVPASKGYESSSTVCLQGHSDMVGVKDEANAHNFATDPIEVSRDGDWIKAKGTTLGADNGIGLAAAMAIATDPDAVHPPLELLVTTGEEVGFISARELNCKRLGMRSTRVLNLDSERTGETFVSCAGVKVIKSKKEVQRTNLDAMGEGDYYELAVSKMAGGHSGLEIHELRGNAIIFMGHLLQSLGDSVLLVSINGGQAMNAIPADCRAVVFVPRVTSMEHVEGCIDKMRHQLAMGVGKLEFTKMDVTTARPVAMTHDTHSEVTEALIGVKNGVVAMSDRVDGLVETSTNLGVVATDGDAVRLDFGIRSSVNEKMDEVATLIREVLGEQEFVTDDDLCIPGWDGDPKSIVVLETNQAYETVTGDKPRVVAVHAGLETGPVTTALSKALGVQVDGVSFGPDIFGAHSPKEKVSIPSVETFYEQLKEVLRALTRV